MTPCSGLSPMAAPPRKCAVSGMLNSSPQVPPATPSIFSAMRRVTSLPAGIQVGFGSPWPCLLSIMRKPNLVFLVKVVIELSRCCMTSAIMVRSLHRRGLSSRSVPFGSASRVLEQLLPARHVGALRSGAVGHQRLQQPHRVGALAVSHRFDVGVGRRVDRRRDRHAVGEVEIVGHRQPARADDGLRVGPRQHAELVGQLRQPALVAHLEQQLLRAVGACRQDRRGAR